MAAPEQAPNYGELCVKGCFAFEFVRSEKRLTMPLVRRQGQFVETSWDDALATVARQFSDLKAEYGPDAIAGFSCARATNEENYLMQTAIGTNTIEHCARL
jgi:formate dehydrogenase major subunit